MTIGEHIKAKRKQFKLTQVDLAWRAGVGLRFVRELERGKASVQLDKVNQVLILFGEELKPVKMRRSYETEKEGYTAPINRYISQEVSKLLFEK